jgi:antitoxin component YwqK of YwqJK toxin-antitoxin module
MQSLNSNITTYILLNYLQYEEITTLQQLFKIKFNTKNHIIYQRISSFIYPLTTIFFNTQKIKEITYYPNKQKMVEYNYKNNEREGLQKRWYDNGLISDQFYCMNGKFHGTFHSYDYDGRLTNILKYYFNQIYSNIKF